MIVIECVSVESTVTFTDGSPDRKDAVSFRVQVFDHCRRVDLEPPVIRDSLVETELFETLFNPFSHADVIGGYDCSAFEYTFKSPQLG